MQAFREVVDHCSFQDMGWRGVPFTWDNKQHGDANVKARLDRAFANASFLDLFEFMSVKHISSTTSDHCYVLAELKVEQARAWPRAAKSFRYENVWQTHGDYDQLIKDAWQRGSGQEGLEGVVSALTSIQHHLSTWGEHEFGNLNKKVRKLQKNLEGLRKASIGRGPSQEEISVARELRETLRQEEIWMHQRSRVTWLREGIEIIDTFTHRLQIGKDQPNLLAAGDGRAAV